jgi:parallel beta-helix repeat protein
MRRIAVVMILILLPVVAAIAWQVLPAEGSPSMAHSPIYISGNSAFTSANGVTAGNGSATNPYIIERWNITGTAQYGLVALVGTTAHAIIRNLVLSNSGGCSQPDGFYFSGVSNVLIANSTVSNANDGILLSGSTNITIVGSAFTRNCLDIEIQSSSNLNIINDTITDYGYGNGVYAHPATYVYFANNNVVTVGSGVQFIGGYTRIVNNTFNNDGLAGVLVQGNNFIVTGNTASNNGDGLEIYGNNNLVLGNTASLDTRGVVVIGSNNTIAKNYVQSNTGNGLVVQQGAYNNITSNYLSSNSGTGITLQSATNTTVSGNNLYKDGTGVSISSSNRTLVYHNNFLLNTKQILITNAFLLWLNSPYPVGGNYWSNYTGVDRCSGPLQNACTGPDGMGDTPMIIPTSAGTVQDTYPLMKTSGTDPAPVWPLGSQITTSNVDFYSVTLSWTAAVDDTAVVAYQLYENNTLLGSSLPSSRYYNVAGLIPGNTYRFTVQANDTGGLQSSDGPSILFTAPRTLPAPQPPASAEVIVNRVTVFDPSTVTINQGQTVDWCNVGVVPTTVIFSSTAKYTVYPVYQSTGNPNPCLFLTFYDAGTFGYYDVYSGATGQIIVLPVPSDFSISSSPSQIASFSSAPGRSTVTITRLGYFAGTVNLTLSISNSSLACSLSGQQATLGPSTIVGLLCQGPKGTYNVTITGTSGTTSRSTSLIYSSGNPPGPGPPSGGNGWSTILGMIISLIDSFAIWIGLAIVIAISVTVFAIIRDQQKRKSAREISKQSLQGSSRSFQA